MTCHTHQHRHRDSRRVSVCKNLAVELAAVRAVLEGRQLAPAQLGAILRAAEHVTV
jgi:phosphoenolpyruvate-protein kinase (PTS system EI component)